MRMNGKSLLKDAAFLGGQGHGQIVVAGHFRLTQPGDDGRLRVDTGWVHNCMTMGGIQAMLGRFVYLDPDGETTFNGWIDCAETLPCTLNVQGMGVGTGTDADYDYFHATEVGQPGGGLQTEVTYLAGGARAARVPGTIALNYGMIQPGISDPRTVATRLMVSGNWPAGIICAAGDTISLSEVGLFDSVTAGAGYMYCAAYFTPVLITGGHPVTAYYTLGISQAAP